MKVLHLFQEYLSISESWAYNLLNASKNTDIAIGCIYFNEENSEYFNSNFSFIRHKKAQLLRKHYQNPSSLSVPSKLMLRAKRKLFKSELNAIRKWIEKEKPDLIHVHFGTTAAHFISLLKGLKIPFIVSFYGYDYEKAVFDLPKLKKKYIHIFTHASAIFVEGVHGKEILLDLGCPQKKIRVIKLGVQVSSDLQHNKALDEKLRLVQIANFVEKKGQEDIVKSVKLYARKWKGRLHITFVGNSKTPYGRKVRKMIRSENLNEYFTFRESIKYSHIPNFLKDYDVFIHPSSYAQDRDCEGGAPTVLLDAQLAGLPVISTLHCDIPSYVIHKHTGLLSPEKDVSELGRSIDYFLELDLSEYLRFSRNARTHIQKNYDIDNNAKILEETYAEISCL